MIERYIVLSPCAIGDSWDVIDTRAPSGADDWYVATTVATFDGFAAEMCAKLEAEELNAEARDVTSQSEEKKP